MRPDRATRSRLAVSQISLRLRSEVRQDRLSLADLKPPGCFDGQMRHLAVLCDQRIALGGLLGPDDGLRKMSESVMAQPVPDNRGLLGGTS